MAVFTEVRFEEAAAFLRGLGLGELRAKSPCDGGIENTNYFIDTDRGEFVLTLFERLAWDALPFYLHLMQHLADRDIPVPSPAPDAEGRILHRLKGKPAAVVGRLRGKSVLAPGARHCGAVGEMLARMHLAGRDYARQQPNLRGLPWWKETVPVLLPCVGEDQRTLLRDELAFQTRLAASPDYAALPRGPIHADLFRDNVMFEGGCLSGILDFYFAGCDTFLFDMAVCLNDWCVDLATGHADSVRRTAFLAAYEAVRPLVPEERRLLPAMERAAALRFWLSRLWDHHMPRDAAVLKAHDPGHFERVLRQRVSDAAGANRSPSRDPMNTLHSIGGRWQPAHDNRWFDVRNPADDSLIAQVSDGGAADARLAADAAALALPAWKARPPRERCLILKKWQALIERDVEPLAQLISREQGKPLAESRGEIAYAAGYVEWFAEEGVRANGEVIAAPVNSKRYIVLREAVGVVAVVTPWNFPAAMIARKIAPALAAGCTVVAKPAEDTPLTALALVKLAEEAGVPPGVLNIVAASRERTPQVVGEWLADPRVRKISFTGSTPVGKLLARDSAATLKKLSLELGGNAPFIVFEDADLDAAVEGLMASKFRNGGQTCVSPNRVYVHAAVHDRFVDKLAARVGALRVGSADWPAAEIGPMINARAVDKIERHVNDAVAKGARVVVGGQRMRNERAAGPNYYAPTVLTNATRDMELSCEETFGPVVPVFRFADEAEVMAQANDTPYGLAGYFYSQDVKRIWRVASALETGMVGINEGAIAAQAAPFGGVKESGYGREGSHWGLDEYLHTKYLCQGGLL